MRELSTCRSRNERRAPRDVVYVGERRRGAMKRLVEVLRSGGVVAILPEGTRSRTGGLGWAERGVAALATLAPAPIVPAAAYGQERASARWRRLRRARVRVRIGPPVRLPPGPHDRQRLQSLTDEVMLAVAAMLPPEYRGVYGQRGPSR